jgi:hypothetical protein
MPGKGRRVASRQAELGKRRRRQGRGAGGVIAGGSEAGAATATEPLVASDLPESPAFAKRTESPVPPRPIPPQAHRSPTRARLDRPAAYNYVVPELRRILIMSGTALAVLVAISVAVSYLI